MAACCLSLTSCARSAKHRIDAAKPREFVFVNRDRARIHDSAFLRDTRLVGAQVKYTWRELEPAPDAYDFSSIENDLEFLRRHGKALFIQLQDVSFDTARVLTPVYLQADPQYHGGIVPQFDVGQDEKNFRVTGVVARRWDSSVRKRFQNLLIALGRRFDGRIEGINLPETAVAFGSTGRLFPPGFTPERYRDAIIETMGVLRRAFPHSVAMVYGNFMPGEWLPDDDHGLLRSIYAAAASEGVAMGGPDLLPNRPAQRKHSYPLLRAHSHGGITGIAVQEGNYADIDRQTGKRLTVEQLRSFAIEELGVTYIFWSTEEPYYSCEVLRLSHGLNCVVRQ